MVMHYHNNIGHQFGHCPNSASAKVVLDQTGAARTSKYFGIIHGTVMMGDDTTILVVFAFDDVHFSSRLSLFIKVGNTELFNGPRSKSFNYKKFQ